MSDTQHGYNGWRNYATWRVMLEVWSDYDWSAERGKFDSVRVLADWLRDETKNVVTEHGFLPMEDAALGYALAFLEQADYDEMAEHVAVDFPEVMS